MTHRVEVNVRIQRLVASLPAHAAPELPARGRLRLGRWLPVCILALAGVVVLVVAVVTGNRPMLATTTVAGMRITYEEGVGWAASIPQAEAEEIGLDWLASMAPSVTDLRVTRVTQIAGVRTVVGAEGTYESSSPINGWMVEVEGNSEEFAFARGSVIVDSNSGRVLGAGMLENNEDGSEEPPTAPGSASFHCGAICSSRSGVLDAWRGARA